MKNKSIIAVYLLTVIGFLALSWMLLSHGLLPIKYRWSLVGIFFLVQIIFGFLAFRISSKKMGKISLSFTLIVLLLAYAGGSYYIKRGMDTLAKLSEKKEEELHFSLVVPKDSTLESWEDIAKKTIFAPLEKDADKLNPFIKELKEKSKKDLKIDKVDSYSKGADDLLKGKIDILLLNEAYRGLIDEEMKDFGDKTRTLDLIKLNVDKVTKKTEDITKKVEKKESFNFYISGMDSYGDIASTVSRSDVNLLLTVNPNTHKILITTIPRDSYLPIAGGGNDGYDKLTHAGVYGIESSIKTLENLLDVDINYYARINFTSLITMVDVLGGIEVENERSFSTGSSYFPQGNIYLNGEQALTFSRERYSLPGGDFDRGRNQGKVLSAMIEKALTPSILLNYNGFLRVVLESAQTNMPREKMVELINGQIDDGSKWKIESVDIKGHTASGLTSYAMPNHNLSMVVLEDDSVEEIKRKIKEIQR